MAEQYEFTNPKIAEMSRREVIINERNIQLFMGDSHQDAMFDYQRAWHMINLEGHPPKYGMWWNVLCEADNFI